MSHWILITKDSTQQYAAEKFYHTKEILVMVDQIVITCASAQASQKSEGQIRFYCSLKQSHWNQMLNCPSELQQELSQACEVKAIHSIAYGRKKGTWK